MKKYSCITFDMDGTITQTNQLIFDSFNHIAKKYLNTLLTAKEIIAMFGPPEEVAIKQLMGSQNFESAVEDFHDFYRTEHNRRAALYAGMIEMFEFLKRKNMIVALFTGKGKFTTNTTLELFEIKRYFDCIITGDDVDEFKPSGDGLKKIIKKFSLQKPDVVMVGDSVSDFRASQDAGVDIASVLWDSYAKEEVSKLPSTYHFYDIQPFYSWLHSMYR